MGIAGLEFECCPIPQLDSLLKKLLTGATCKPAFWRRVGIYIDETNTISTAAFFHPGSVYQKKFLPKWMQDMIRFGGLTLTDENLKEMLSNVKSLILSNSSMTGIEDLEKMKGNWTWEFRKSVASIEQKFKMKQYQDRQNLEIKQLFVRCDPFEIGAHFYQYIVTYKDGKISSDMFPYANTNYVVDKFFKDDPRG